MDYDFIEVAKGKYLKLSSRQFVDCPFEPEEYGVVSPRNFKNYKIQANPDAGYFESAINHWFSNINEKVNFMHGISKACSDCNLEK